MNGEIASIIRESVVDEVSTRSAIVCWELEFVDSIEFALLRAELCRVDGPDGTLTTPIGPIIGSLVVVVGLSLILFRFWFLGRDAFSVTLDVFFLRVEAKFPFVILTDFFATRLVVEEEDGIEC